jgi:hypothetical protein
MIAFNHASELENDTISSGINTSFLFSLVVEPIVFEKLKQNVNTEILIVGGGIAENLWQNDYL